MFEFLQVFFSPGSFIPHGHCYLWQTPLVWLHILSDGFIALAYYSIPIFLIALAHKRQDLPFRPLFWLFGGFIISCGTTHWMDVITLWYPAYWLSGTIKAITALLSVWTALELVPLFPKAVALPSIKQCELANWTLQEEVVERKRVETALRESQDLNAKLSAAALKEKEDVLHLFAQYAPAGIAMFDREMRYVTASQRWADDYYLGTVASLIGQSQYKLFPQIPERWRQVYQRCLAGATEQCDEDLFVRVDGVQKVVRWEVRPWYESLGEVGGIIIFAEDITERKQAEAKLKEQEASYRQLFESNPQPMWVYDLETLRFLAVNPVAIAKYGYSEDEFLSMTIADIRPTDDVSRLLENVASVSEGLNFAGLWHHRLKDGRLITVEIVSHTLEFAGRRAELVMAHDVTERQAAEAKLQEREELLRLFAQYAPAGIVMLDRNMNYIMASHRWVQDVNLPPVDSIIGRSHYEVFPDIPPRWREVHQRCLAGAVEKCDEDLLLRADGTQQWKRWEMRPWHDAHGQIGGLILFAEDITQRKQSEAALQESQLRFQALVEAMFEGIVIQEHGRILEANPGFAKMFGYSVEEVIGKTAIEFLTPESLETLRRYIEDRDESPYEMIGIKKDGTRINLEVVGKQSVYQGRIVRISAARDITDRKRAEAALQQLNAELEQRVAERTVELQTLSDRLMEAQAIAQIGSWEYEIATGNIFWSDEIFRIYGLEPGQSEPDYESHLEQQFTSEDGERLRQAVARALEQGEPYELDLQIIRADDSTGWILAKGKPILNEHNQVVRLVGVALDITERKAIEAQQRLLSQMKDDFLSTVSHELRSPLASIKMAIEMLELMIGQLIPVSAPGTDVHTKQQRLQRYLGILSEQCDQELELVNNLLDLQRLEADRIQVSTAPIDVFEWTSNIAAAFEGRMQERQQHLQVLLPDELPPFSSDVDILTHVLRELFTNACKYTPPGETITVEVCSTATHLQLRVNNSGVQIVQEDLERIFEKFYRIPKSDQWKQGGTGLGLALIQKQVDYLGGTLWAESDELGVHFIVRLPFESDSAY